MTSAKQAQANRLNALKSTGPKTPEGRAAVRLNALKHGLQSREVLLPNEDESVLEELSERLRAELQPVGEMENLLVDRIIAATWRLRRLGRVEAGVFAFELYGELAARARREAGKYARTETEVYLGDYKLGEDVKTTTKTTITDEQKHQEAVKRAREMESVRERGARHARANLYPGRQQGERILQALPLRDRHRAEPLQGPARTQTLPGRPSRRGQRPPARGRGRERLRGLEGGRLKNGFVS